MSISSIGIIFGIAATVSGVLTASATYYFNNEFVPRGEKHVYDGEYVTLASQNLNLLYDAEDELAALQRRMADGTATPDDLKRVGVLEERIRNLKTK